MTRPPDRTTYGLALAPACDGVLLGPRHRKKPKPHDDALILLSTSESDENTSAQGPQHSSARTATSAKVDSIVGRHSLRLAHWQMCPCQQGSAYCERCQFAWIKRVLPRQCLRIILVVPSRRRRNSKEHTTDSEEKEADENHGDYAELWVHDIPSTTKADADDNRTFTILDSLHINGRCVRDILLFSEASSSEAWKGPLRLQAGDSLVFQPPPQQGSSDDENRQRHDRPLEFQVVWHKNGKRLVFDTKKDALQRGVKEDIQSEHASDTAKEQQRSDSALARSSSPLVSSPDNETETEFSSPLKTQPRNFHLGDDYDQDDDDFEHFLQASSSSSRDEDDDDDVTKEPTVDEAKSGVDPAVEEPLPKDGNDDTEPKAVHPGHGEEETTIITSSHPKLYFVKSNRYWEMHNEKAREKAKTRALARGAMVVDSLDRQDPPTHLIVARKLRMDEGELLLEDLGFDSVQELNVYMEDHGVAFARLGWVMKDESTPFGPVTRQDELYRMIVPGEKADSKRTTASEANQHASPQKRLKKSTSSDSQVDEGMNKELAELFTALSTLYKEAPLDDQDLWRAYTFSRAASVLRHITYAVSIDTLKELKQERGFADSCLRIAKEFVETRRCERLRKLQADKDRSALRAFTGIWGAGPKKAKELLRMGYHDIDSLRKATEEGKILWQRNEYLGLKYYEDINDEMDRAEAKQIGDTVISLVHSRSFYPSADVEILGSYRRNKSTCGDVDMLVTDPSWGDEVPPTFLGSLVERLREDGLVLHHLTLVHGMDQNVFDSLDASDRKYIRASSEVADKRHKKTHDKRSYTWFGIVRSPVHKDKVRRLDIKAYPYTERIYSKLYFTGNGHFNRAMRFWSNKKKPRPWFKLDDHGLWVLNDFGKPILDEDGQQTRASLNGRTFFPKEERDVFDFLDLEWREPEERDGFGAVQSKQEEDLNDTPVTMADVLSDTREFAWVD